MFSTVSANFTDCILNYLTSKAGGYAQGMLHGMNDRTFMTLMDASFYFISIYFKFQL